MHAVFDRSPLIRNTLRYHENKISNGLAECLVAGNALKDLNQLTWEDKLYHFERMNVRNEQTFKKTLHFSLNFHPSEKERLTNNRMQAIAEQYIKKMELHRQPYLIYRHYDTLHPHCHVVCSQIQENGKRLALKLKDFYKSKELTVELEKQYSLIPSGMGIKQKERVQLAPLQKIVYGKTPIAPAFNRVLEAIIDKYKYTSLHELNAVLGLYNMEAYRGKENSPAWQKKGLYYRTIVPERGKKDVRIKASDIDDKPTLSNLEKKFQLNQSESLRPQHRQRVTSAIDWTLIKSSLTLNAFGKALEKERISAVFKKDAQGALEQVYYVDHQNKSVFDGAVLGGKYTAAALRKRCIPELEQRQELTRELTPEQTQKLTGELMREQLPRPRPRQHQQEQELEIGD